MTKFITTVWMVFVVFFVLSAQVFIVSGAPPEDRDAEIGRLTQQLSRIPGDGVRNDIARENWKTLDDMLTPAEAANIIWQIGQEGSTPLGDNYLRSLVDSVFERTVNNGGELPVGKLRTLFEQRSCSAKARTLAFEWLMKGDLSDEESLLTGMLDDPSVELRRKAVARLIEKADAMSDSDQAEKIGLYRQALGAARDLDQIDAMIEKLKGYGEEVDEAWVFGYLTEWKVVGPFDNTDEKGYAERYSPEKLVHRPELTSEKMKFEDGKHGEVAWKSVTVDDPRGMLNFNEVLGEEKSVCAYAYAEIECPEPLRDRIVPAQLRLQSFNALKVWVNNRLVAEYDVYHGGSEFDQYIIDFVLAPGKNTIMVKACQNNQPQDWARKWYLQLRVTDPTGGALLR